MIRQVRILYPQFLFRLMDAEFLSPSARGDSSVLLGQFLALLIFGGLIVGFGAIPFGNEIRRTGLAAPLWTVERFLLSLTMLMVGIFALVSWDSAFPDRRDALVLGPLPVRGWSMFTAKILADASGMAITIAALNWAGGFLWPLILPPQGLDFIGRCRVVAVFWMVHFLAGAFTYCAVLALQALAAQLPRAWYLRLAPALQSVGFSVILGVFCLQPSITGNALAAPANQTALAWLPTYWFTGLLSEWSGLFAAESHALMSPLARRALAGLSLAILAAGCGFLLASLRTLRKIVESPDSSPVARGGLPLPSFGTGPRTALAHFIIRTLWRSRQHRVLVGFWTGGGFAFVVLYVAITLDVMRLTGADLLRHTSIPLLAASVVLFCAAWMGARTTFSLPFDLRANWLFRVPPTPSASDCHVATRRALLFVALAPVATIAGAVFFWFWPWTSAVGHLTVLALLATVLADLSLRGFLKIPFTCSYLPGKSKAHMVFWFGVIPFFFLVHQLVDWEIRAMEAPLSFAAMLAGLGALAATVRWTIARNIAQDGPDIRFDEIAADDIVELRLGD